MSKIFMYGTKIHKLEWLLMEQKWAESLQDRVEQRNKAINTVYPQVKEPCKKANFFSQVHKGMKLEIQFHSAIVLKQNVDYLIRK